LLERTVNFKIEDIYPKLKAALVAKDWKVVLEESPRHICFKQGSLWGMTPQSAKKTINVNLTSVEDGTQVKCSSKLASDWKNITLIGCVFAFVLVVFCVWLATDLSALVTTRVPGFWSWLVTVGGNVNLVAAQALVNLTRGLAAFLSLIILSEAAIVVYAHSKIDIVAEAALKQLS
jgi:hypothetical protein